MRPRAWATNLASTSGAFTDGVRHFVRGIGGTSRAFLRRHIFDPDAHLQDIMAMNKGVWPSTMDSIRVFLAPVWHDHRFAGLDAKGRRAYTERLSGVIARHLRSSRKHAAPATYLYPTDNKVSGNEPIRGLATITSDSDIEGLPQGLVLALNDLCSARPRRRPQGSGSLSEDRSRPARCGLPRPPCPDRAARREDRRLSPPVSCCPLFRLPGRLRSRNRMDADPSPRFNGA